MAESEAENNTNPVVNRIHDALRETLRGISRANGYEVEAIVVDTEPQGLDARAGTILVQWGDESPLEAPHGCDAYAQTFDLMIFDYADTEGGEDTIDRKLTKLVAAARHAVEKNLNDTQRGYVHNWRWGTATNVNAGGSGLPARKLPLTVHYRTLRGNPYRPLYNNE